MEQPQDPVITILGKQHKFSTLSDSVKELISCHDRAGQARAMAAQDVKINETAMEQFKVKIEEEMEGVEPSEAPLQSKVIS